MDEKENQLNNLQDEQERTKETSEAGYEQQAYTYPSRSVVKKKKQDKLYKELIEWIKAIIFAVVLVFLLRTFLYSPFLVDGNSMLPNFENGERVIVNVFTYRFNEPKFGDVIVLNVPEENKRFIKRVIGVPGDKVELREDQLFINEQLVEEPYLAEAIASRKEYGESYNGQGERYNFPNSRITDNIVPEDYYFVLGDNRGDSTDSRYIGYVHKDEIIGRVDLILWPFDKISIVRLDN